MSECPYCTNAFEVNDTCHDEFRMWQGLVGPYYIPTIEDGVLTWTNTGGLPNPNPINIIGAQGNGLYIGGIAETTGDLPETAENGVTWLVGADEPYEGYVYLNGSWVDIGAVTPGPTGPQGIPGAGVPSGGTTGQVLQKASNTDYQTEWADPESGGDPPGTMLPLMDGTAAVGTARSYAREDHVHPQDSEISELKTSLNQLASDVDAAKTATETLENGLAIPKTGDTADTALSVGTFINLTGNSTLDDGLYQVSSAISQGATYTTSNLTKQATNNGALNTLMNNSGTGYCKMPDGTLICWGDGAIYVTDTPSDRKQFTFPVAFASNPKVFLQVEENSYNVLPILLIWGLSTTGCYALNRASTPNKHILFKWLAVGRWK